MPRPLTQPDILFLHHVWKLACERDSFVIYTATLRSMGVIDTERELQLDLECPRGFETEKALFFKREHLAPGQLLFQPFPTSWGSRKTLP